MINTSYDFVSAGAFVLSLFSETYLYKSVLSSYCPFDQVFLHFPSVVSPIETCAMHNNTSLEPLTSYKDLFHILQQEHLF